MKNPTDQPWFVGAATATAVLLDAAHRRVHEGEYALAVALAEELLDLDPDNTDALLLVADAAPRYGHGEVGVLAARSAATLGAEPCASLAAALCASGLAEEALAEADSCLLGGKDLPRAHAVRALALEVLGRISEADDALAQAHTLLPAAYPLPLAVADDEWDSLLLRAISGLARNEQAAIRHWQIEFHGSPRPDTLARSSPPLPPSSLSSLLEPEEGPPVCLLYRRNLTRGCDSEEVMVERMTGALRDELAWLTNFPD